MIGPVCAGEFVGEVVVHGVLILDRISKKFSEIVEITE